MVTVSMEAPRSGHAGFQISKTIRCFWRTLYNMLNYWAINGLSSFFSLYPVKLFIGGLREIAVS
jgi:hypothetical protein